MSPDDVDSLDAHARRLRAWWERLHGVRLYQAITCDMQAATAAARGDLLLHGAKRPRVAAATDARAADLDAINTARLSPGCRALLTGRTVCIDDVLDAADDNDAWCALAVASDVTAVLSVPLVVPHGTVAAVTLFADTPAHFTRERRTIAAAIAGAAADLILTELARGRVERIDPASGLDPGGRRVALVLRHWG